MKRPSPARILLADDEVGMRELFHFCLEPMGYEIVTVPDGVQAVAAVLASPFDLVVLDVHMPLMTGPEALTEIWKHRPGQKILVLSSSSDVMHTFETAIGREGIRCLFKPASLEELTCAIEALLGESLSNGRKGVPA